VIVVQRGIYAWSPPGQCPLVSPGGTLHPDGPFSAVPATDDLAQNRIKITRVEVWVDQPKARAGRVAAVGEKDGAVLVSR